MRISRWRIRSPTTTGATFVAGTQPAELFYYGELRSGAKALHSLHWPKTVAGAGIVWDGRHIAVINSAIGFEMPVYRLAGNHLAGTSYLTGTCNLFQFFVDRNRLICADQPAGVIRIYPYPQGGLTTRAIVDSRLRPIAAVVSRLKKTGDRICDRPLFMAKPLGFLFASALTTSGFLTSAGLLCGLLTSAGCLLSYSLFASARFTASLATRFLFLYGDRTAICQIGVHSFLLVPRGTNSVIGQRTIGALRAIIKDFIESCKFTRVRDTRACVAYARIRA